jgi:predicted GNAT superfamily acetyltransferase
MAVLNPNIEIRTLTTYAEMLEIPPVQQAIWRFSDSTGFYPPSLLACAENGGLVLGAYDRTSGALIGFCFGFLARHWDGQLKLYSQAMGVLPEYRGQDIAFHLKCRQREWALTQDLRLITWTYDPLEMPNARLNIAKLGGIVRRYKRNMYGDQFGELNAGLPTDRFVVEWLIASERVAAAVSGAPLPGLDDAVPASEVAGEGHTRRLIRYNTELDAPAVSVEVLPDLQATKALDLELARAWRLDVRALCEGYFARGYAVTGFVTERGNNGERRNWYVLRRDESAWR